MQFSHTYSLILAGTKTQTRRLFDQDTDHMVEKLFTTDAGVGFRNGLYKDGRMKWLVGNTYAVQPGRGQRAVGRIRVTGLRLERLQAITEADARAEGVDSVQAYAALWDAIHSKRGERWSDNPLVVVIQFELADASQR